MAMTEELKGTVSITLGIKHPFRLVNFSVGLVTLTGYPAAVFKHSLNTLEKLIYARDVSKTLADISAQLDISNTVSTKTRITTMSGDVLSVVMSGQVLADDAGRENLHLVLSDITQLEAAAIESEQAKSDLDVFANTVPSGLSKHLLDNKLTLLWANKYFYKICGYTEMEFKKRFGHNSLAFILSTDLALVINALADLSEEEEPRNIYFRIRDKLGDIRWINASLARSGESRHGTPILNMVMTDITSLKIAEQRAQLAEQKYTIISDISEELPYEYDIENNVITFAEKFTSIFGAYPIIKHPARRLVQTGLVSEDTKDALYELFRAARSGGRHATELKLKTVDSGYQWYFTIFSTIYNEERQPVSVVGLLRNIHAQKLEQQRLTSRAESDLMTGLLNKATTESRVSERLSALNGTSLDAFLLIDIDDFKTINDTHGHGVGDKVILDLAEILKKSMRGYDLAGRVGGDEFCLYLADLPDINIACQRAELLNNELLYLYPPEGNLHVTLSIGVVALEHAMSYRELLNASDIAMYRTKSTGKNGFTLFREDMARTNYVNPREERH